MTQLAAKVLKETGGDAAKACEAVIFRALETDSKDNISCMIVLLGGENRRTATPNPDPNSNPNREPGPNPNENRQKELGLGLGLGLAEGRP